MYLLKFDLKDEKVQYLVKSDEKLGKLLKYIRTSELTIEKNGFQCLVKYIIGQQISDKARETIWQRLCVTLGDVMPDIILSTEISELRSLGLSGRKAEYIKSLAVSASEKVIDFEEYRVLSNKEIIDKLTELKGIGQWTAEMYLIFSLGRENVLSKQDRTIRRAIQWMYNLESIPSAEELTEYFSNWIKNATIVSSYLWKAIALGLTRKSFDEIVVDVK